MINEWVRTSYEQQVLWSVPTTRLLVPTKCGPKKDSWKTSNKIPIIPTCREQSLAHVCQSHRKATVTQTAEEVNARFNGKASECTVHHRLLCIRVHSCTQARVLMSTAKSTYNGHQLNINWTMGLWKKVACSDESCFLYLMCMTRCVYCLSGKDRIHYGTKASQHRYCVALDKNCYQSLGPGIHVAVIWHVQPILLPTKYITSWQPYF